MTSALRMRMQPDDIAWPIELGWLVPWIRYWVLPRYMARAPSGLSMPPGMCSGGAEGSGGSIQVALHPASFAEGSRIFDALAEGGQVIMPFAETFWAAGFGHVIDRWGTNWMVNVEREPAASSAA